ncbi:MAG TPA: hypothetical protein VKA38_01930 [Draconibacterium sp.]|nr:hypothetical protein [Draconibacterium sp.]
MKGESFKLENSLEVKLFESELKKYYEYKMERFPYLTYFNLVKWFDHCKKNKDDGRLFTMILDIKLNFIYLDIDFIEAGNIFYKRLENDLDSDKIIMNGNFKESLDLLHVLSDYVTRYRALMDKLMGLLVILFAPKDYEKYRRARSRKNKFKNIFKETDLPININIEALFNFLEKFDSKYRTPEVHSTGSLRKSVLLSAEKGYKEIRRMKGESWFNLISLISEIDNFVIKDK